MPKIMTTKSFIERSREIHGNRYNYSKSEYVRSKDKILIICKKHGEFLQKANNHLSGYGCAKCGGRESLNTEIFIKRATEMHKGKYDYSLVNYKNSKTNVIIICQEHGEFLQTPSKHLYKQHGCQKCGGSVKFTKKNFIELSKKVHGNLYDYSLVDYKNNNTKIKIICRSHGIFNQIPMSHLVGNGCPNCKISKGEEMVKKYLKNLNIKYIQQHRFEECRYKNTLPFDFYLPNLNTCIEFNGGQHYKPIEYFGGDNSFEIIKQKDIIKRNFCLINGINLIEIKYNENINGVLNKKLNIEHGLWER